jgi:TPR repeat protein
MLGLATYFEENDRVLEARRWYRQAGKRGNDRARIRLAFLSEEYEPRAAVELYEQVLAHEGALPKDLRNAAYRLALLLLEGDGAPADPLRAGELLELAAGLGHERARTHLRRMRERGRIPPATGDGGGKR